MESLWADRANIDKSNEKGWVAPSRGGDPALPFLASVYAPLASFYLDRTPTGGYNRIRLVVHYATLTATLSGHPSNLSTTYLKSTTAHPNPKIIRKEIKYSKQT